MKRLRGTCAAAIGLLLLATPAGAQESAARSGWWTAAPIAAAPDSGEDGLLVQGSPDPDGPLAYAAVSIPLDLDARPATLTLEVAPDSASTPGASLAVCPLTTSTFEPAQGGAAEDGPEYDCAVSVTAAPSDDGTTYEFEIADIPAVGAVALAIVPTAATDRVLLTAPGADSLTTTRSAAGDSDSDSGSDSGGDGGFDSSGIGGGSFDPGPGDAPSFDVPETPEAAVGAVEDGDAARSPAAAQLAAAAPVSSSEDDGRSLAPFLFGGLAVAAAALWMFAGQMTQEEGEPG